MADYQIEALLFCTPRLWNYSHCDIIIISSSSSPRCYKIYWFITLKDLFVSRSITSFFLNYGMSFLGEEGLAERDRKGHGGVKNVHFLGDILNGYSPISGENAILTKRRANSR